MFALCIAVMVLSVPPVEGATLTAVAPPAAEVAHQPLVPLRSGPGLREAAHAALRRWARPADKETDLAAREFIVLYKELEADDQLARTQREGLRTKVRGRLLALSRQIQKRVAVRKRLARQQRPESVALPAGEGVLAQWGGFGRQGGPRGGFGGRGLGGPMGGGFGGAVLTNNDHGQELIELIQQTIAPSTWDVNGGLGSIYYWQPGHALVIRQTGEVHDQIGDVLQQMGRMGR